MTEQSVTRITLYRTALSYYSEQETAAASHLSVNTIRHFRALDLIGGEEMDGELRYSGEEVTRLRRIRRLQYELGINLAGVEVILRLLKRLETAHQELEQVRSR